MKFRMYSDMFLEYSEMLSKQWVTNMIFLDVVYLQLLLPVFPYPGWISPEFVSLSNRILNLQKDYS